jgi:hypothetical protein
MEAKHQNHFSEKYDESFRGLRNFISRPIKGSDKLEIWLISDSQEAVVQDLQIELEFHRDMLNFKPVHH